MEAIIWAMKARGLTPTAWKLLLKLCDRVNNEREDFDVWPSQKLIAGDCEISVATVKRHLRELVDEGYLRIIGQFDSRTNSKTVNRYRIQVRTRAVMPKEFVAIEPQGPASPSAQYAPAYDSTVTPPIAQSDLGGEVTGELTEPTESRTYPSEPNPPLPSEEAPPKGDSGLFGEQLPIVAKPSILDYVADRWKELCEEYPRTIGVRVWNDARKKAVARRAAEVVRASQNTLDAYQVWDLIFAAIRGSVFLRGEGEPSKNYSEPFALNIDYILRPKEFAQTLERATNDAEHTRVTHDATTGRKLGPAEQAARGALARLRADRQQGGRS